MKISKSKRQLAQLLIEAGIKQFPDGANWAAQDASGLIYCYTDKPDRAARVEYWLGESIALIANSEVIVNNWHQTVLSRAEFDQVVAEGAEQGKPDADGWIEWGGGECPVGNECIVSYKMRNAETFKRGEPASKVRWTHNGADTDIIAYRLHKPEHAEPQYCESVTRAIPQPITAPTLDQLLQDYRNASAFAAAKQAEADEAAKMRDERWKAAQARACELGVHISVELVVDAEMRESEPVITDWRDLRVGDVIQCVGNWEKEDTDGKEFEVIGLERPGYNGPKPIQIRVPDVPVPLTWGGEFRFVRRP